MIVFFLCKILNAPQPFIFCFVQKFRRTTAVHFLFFVQMKFLFHYSPTLHIFFMTTDTELGWMDWFYENAPDSTPAAPAEPVEPVVPLEPVAPLEPFSLALNDEFSFSQGGSIVGSMSRSPSMDFSLRSGSTDWDTAAPQPVQSELSPAPARRTALGDDGFSLSRGVSNKSLVSNNGSMSRSPFMDPSLEPVVKKLKRPASLKSCVNDECSHLMGCKAKHCKVCQFPQPYRNPKASRPATAKVGSGNGRVKCCECSVSWGSKKYRCDCGATNEWDRRASKRPSSRDIDTIVAKKPRMATTQRMTV